MRATTTQDGLTVRAIAGTHNILLGFDLHDGRQSGCLGFSIQRTDLGPGAAPLPLSQQQSRWLPNLLRFPQDTAGDGANPTSRSPVQQFHWGDWTAYPGHAYCYRVTAQYGQWNNLAPGPTVEVEITTEDPRDPQTSVYFNRGAAASNAYNLKFGSQDPAKLPPDKQARAYAWLSHGLEEALLAFLDQAKDSSYALHAAIYEFQKPNLLQGLQAALQRGVDVRAVYHARKTSPADHTGAKNAAAAHAAGLDAVCVPRKANPQDAISHNKFVVLLKDGLPQAVWTGSTNWTDGAIYGQFNLGQAFYDPDVARVYDAYWEQLHSDAQAGPLKSFLSSLSPVPGSLPPGPCVLPVFSPQPDKKMLDLYASLCAQARVLLVCAPFELAPEIRKSFESAPDGVLRFILADKNGSLGPDQEEIVKINDNEVSVATTLSSPLHDFQNKLLEGKEAYHHAGVHIHAKIIAADPFGPDPILVMGSANFSDNSTLNNDSNSVVLRGYPAVADIYATEFLRMFEHYRFRGFEAASKTANQPLGLAEDDRWTVPFYQANSRKALTRQMFAGTATFPEPPLGA